MKSRWAVAALVALVASPAVAACSTDDETTLTVLAAASLTGTFEDLAASFEDQHPGVDVRLAFDSSATLAQQALEGAPADVLATADVATMDRAADALATEPRVFATNTMVLVTPAGNPADVTGLDSLVPGGPAYVVCVESAPCGMVARALLEAAGVSAEPASLEVDVKAVLAKVTSAEADAGIVYATDAVAAGSTVERFEIPGAEAEVTSYSVAVLEQSGSAGLAGEFVDLVRSPDGQQVLADAGFGPP